METKLNDLKKGKIIDLADKATQAQPRVSHQSALTDLTMDHLQEQEEKFVKELQHLSQANEELSSKNATLQLQIVEAQSRVEKV